MGRCGVILLVLSAALVALLAYAVYMPMPEGFSEPWKVRAMLAPMYLCVVYVPVMSIVSGTTLEQESKNCINKLFSYTVAKPEDLQVSDFEFSGVPVRLYKPDSAQPNSPAIVFTHGGGWSIGSLDMYDEVCYWLSRSTTFPVISVDYRLAPEHVYPAAFHDCVNATRYLINHAGQFDVDPSRIVVMGDSAGGNLAAAVSQHLRDVNSTPPLKLQVLVYPALQAFNFRLPSIVTGEFTMIDPTALAQAWIQYGTGRQVYTEEVLQNRHITEEAMLEFGHLVDPDELPAEFIPDGYEKKIRAGSIDSKLWDEIKVFVRDPYFSPGLAKNLNDLPKAYIVTVANDPLRDEAILYAKRLAADGTPVTHQHLHTGFHAILSMPMFKETSELRDPIITFLLENV